MQIKIRELRAYNPTNSLVKIIKDMAKKEGASDSDIIKNLLMSHPSIKVKLEKQ